MYWCFSAVDKDSGWTYFLRHLNTYDSNAKNDKNDKNYDNNDAWIMIGETINAITLFQ